MAGRRVGKTAEKSDLHRSFLTSNNLGDHENALKPQAKEIKGKKMIVDIDALLKKNNHNEYKRSVMSDPDPAVSARLDCLQ